MKRVLLFKIIVLLALPMVVASSAKAADTDLRKWSFGVTYAGGGVGYRFSPRWSTEVRAQALSDVVVAGMRENFFLKPRWGINPYLGLEADYTKFEGVVTKGKGCAAEGYLGAEYYFAGVWSAVLDVGPAWISIEDDDTSESVDGWAGVINIGINYHFGRVIH